MLKQRKYYLIISVTCLVSAFLLLYLSEYIRTFRGFFGDFLIVIFMFSCIKTVFTKWNSLYLSVAVLVFSFLVEIIQIFRLDQYLNVDHFLIELTLGTTFDPLDLIFYFLGVVFIYNIAIRMDKKFEKF